MLSQAVMDSIAQHAVGMYGTLMETVTYLARATPTDTPVSSTVQAKCRAYSARELHAEVLELLDQECRIQTAAVTWQPSHYDQIQRADGTTWMVLSWRDGPGHAWLKLQIRQVG
jgi:hypothetical protein